MRGGSLIPLLPNINMVMTSRQRSRYSRAQWEQWHGAVTLYPMHTTAEIVGQVVFSPINVCHGASNSSDFAVRMTCVDGDEKIFRICRGRSRRRIGAVGAVDLQRRREFLNDSQFVTQHNEC